jgi:hypothetical protein
MPFMYAGPVAHSAAPEADLLAQAHGLGGRG